ncbi:MAG: CBS domain-containing protein [Acidimicrobiia bacterium]|nr:CBS domain-containing protein [Acidimicrobiia bacterium]
MIISDLVAGPPLGCRSDVPLTEAAAKMIAEGVGSLAVFDGERLIGIVTDRDIVQSVADSTALELSVGDVMTTEPDTVGPDLKISDAVDWLNATGYRHLPVTDGNQLVGIVSVKDLLWAISEL